MKASKRALGWEDGQGPGHAGSISRAIQIVIQYHLNDAHNTGCILMACHLKDLRNMDFLSSGIVGLFSCFVETESQYVFCILKDDLELVTLLSLLLRDYRCVPSYC